MADAPENTQLWYLQVLLRQNGCKYGQGDDWQCPAHDDDNASLGVSQGEKGVVLHCAAGCHPTEVLAALGTTWPIVFAYEPGDPAFKETPDDAGQARSGQKSLEDQAKAHGGVVKRTAYEYRTPDGDLARKVIRFDFGDGTKTIRQKIHDKCPVLYHYALVRKGIDAGLPVYVCEGEKSVDRLNAVAGKGEQRRAVVTCSPGGAEGWTDGHGELLAGASKVVVIADNDPAGFRYARAVVDSLDGRLGFPVSVVRSATNGKGDDICEHLDAKFKIRELVPVDLDAELAVDKVDDDVPDDEIGLKLPDVIPVAKPERPLDPFKLVWPTPNQPLEVARWLAKYIVYPFPDGEQQIRFWRDKWFYWTPEVGHYTHLEPKRFHGQISDILRRVKCYNSADPPEQVPWQPRSARVDEVLVFLRGLDVVNVEGTERPGVRLSDGARFQIVNLRNGVLDLSELPEQLSDLRLRRPSPDYFTFSALPFDYDPAAECPMWEKFLGEVWPDDPDSVSLLQEWFGYVLSEDMHQEKFLALYGVPQSGKTTIDNLLRALLGGKEAGAVASFSFSQLGGRFGKIGFDTKKLMITGDSRWNGKENDEVVMNILAITGRSDVEIEHKGVDKYTATPTARMMIVSNERPSLSDPSNALMRRLMILRTRHSCPPERKDTHLDEKLVSELPGILNWALRGLQRLRAADQFTAPASSASELEEVARSQSDIAAFIADRCDIVRGGTVTCAAFADAYRQWREEEGMSFQPSNKKISAELTSRFPDIEKGRHGDPRKGEQAWTWFGITLRDRNLKVRAR